MNPLLVTLPALMLPAACLGESLGIASWYGDELRGSTMANGQPFDPDALTCATRLYPMGTWLRVVCGDREVLVRVTDRGPSRRFPERIIDLSHRAFSALAHPDKGLIQVRVERVANPPIS